MMKKKNLLIFLGIIVLIVIIVVLGFYFFNKQDLCKKIDNETFKQKCLACGFAEDSTDCKDNVYIELAFFEKDLSLCEDLTHEYNKIKCRVNLEKAISRGSGVPNYEEIGGGYREVS